MHGHLEGISLAIECNLDCNASFHGEFNCVLQKVEQDLLDTLVICNNRRRKRVVERHPEIQVLVLSGNFEHVFYLLKGVPEVYLFLILQKLAILYLEDVKHVINQEEQHF